MGAKEDYRVAVEAAEACARVDGGAEAAGAARTMPPFARAIVVPEELPEMPAAIIDGILLETHKMLLTGPSKSHKTWGLIALAISVAAGGRWMGFQCAERKVLYLDFETDARTLQKRISTVAYAKGADVGKIRGNLTVWPLRGTSFSLEQIVEELLARCGKGEYGMVVIDPAYMVQDGDENNARDIREFFARLDRICVGLECAVVISHHHSKGAQGMKSAIDRSSGSGVFGRAPDAVLDMTGLVLDAGTLEMASKINSIAACRHPSAWRVSFTLREFEPRPPMDVWFLFPLHVVDSTGLLADCKPNYGGLTEARRQQLEADGRGKVAAVDAACERLIAGRESFPRDDLARELSWSVNTVKDWLRQSKRFEGYWPGFGKSLVRRRVGNGGVKNAV